MNLLCQRVRWSGFVLWVGLGLRAGIRLLLVERADRIQRLLGLPVERDLYYETITLKELMEMHKQQRYVRSLRPIGIAVILVGGCKFDSVERLRQLEAWRWDYVLRQKAIPHICLAQEAGWKDVIKLATEVFPSLITKTVRFPTW